MSASIDAMADATVPAPAMMGGSAYSGHTIFYIPIMATTATMAAYERRNESNGDEGPGASEEEEGSIIICTCESKKGHFNMYGSSTRNTPCVTALHNAPALQAQMCRKCYQLEESNQ